MVAVHALVFLDHHDYKVSSEELAENICTNPARVRKIMAKLCKAGLAQGHAGVVGGYEIARDGYQVTLLEVFDAVGNKIIKQPWRSGDEDMDCQISSGMAKAMDTIFDGMNGECRDYLAGLTIGSVEEELHLKKEKVHKEA